MHLGTVAAGAVTLCMCMCATSCFFSCISRRHGITHLAITHPAHLVGHYVGRPLRTFERRSEPGQTFVG
jgi:hypothetical protein